MASSDVIKQKIVLEGEKEYRQALKDASRNLKTLQSDLKAETAELGANATAQQKAEVRAKSLQKQIKEQEKIVETYKKALEEVREKYGENDDAIAQWEVKLNNARTTLANMKNGLEGVGQAFDGVKQSADMSVVASNSLADSFSRISDMGSSISDSIEGVFTGMMERVRALCGEIWNLIAETAAKADQWGDLASMYGSNAEEIQKMDRAITGAGGSFEDFLALINMLEFKGKDEKLISWLGLSNVNYEDNVAFAKAVMEQMVKRKNEVGAGAFNKEMADVFGGKSTGVISLIDRWDSVQANYNNYAENGYFMSPEAIETMGTVQNKLDDITTKWDMLKSKFTEGLFGGITVDVMTEVQGGLDAIARYFNAETDDERNEALQDLETSIVNAFDKLKKAFEEGLKLLETLAEDFKKSDNPFVKGLGTFMEGIVNALKWISEDGNMDKVVSAFEVFFGLWITGKGATFISKIAELAGHITTIKNYKGLNSLLNGGGTGGTGGSDGGSGAKWGVGSLLARFLGSPIGVLAASAVGTIALGNYMTNQTFKRDWGEYWEHRANQEGREDTPEILKRLGEAGFGTEEYDPDADRMAMAKAMFEQYGNEMYKLDPNSQFWRNGAVSAFLADGILSSDELKSITENSEEFAIQADDWERLMVNFYNLLSAKWESDDLTGVPADWWKTAGETENGVTSQDLANFNNVPQEIGKQIKSSMSGIKVVLDGETVGRLVAPSVSGYIASQVTMMPY